MQLDDFINDFSVLLLLRIKSWLLTALIFTMNKRNYSAGASSLTAANVYWNISTAFSLCFHKTQLSSTRGEGHLILDSMLSVHAYHCHTRIGELQMSNETEGHNHSIRQAIAFHAMGMCSCNSPSKKVTTCQCTLFKYSLYTMHFHLLDP